jgi:hypothetical protein
MLFQESEEFSGLVDEPWCKQIRHQFNVRHIEQFAALIASPEGRVALEAVGVPVAELQDKTERNIKRVWGVSLSDPLGVGKSAEGKQVNLLTTERLHFGFDAGKRDRFKGLAFGSEIPPVDGTNGKAKGKSKHEGWFSTTPDPLPTEFFLLKGFPKARDQVSRGTCVAFTVSGMWEIMARCLEQDPIQLSPQFVFYWCKKEDGSELSDGTSLTWGLHVLRQYGTCREEYCEYVGYHDFGQSYHYDHEPDAEGKAAAIKDAKRHKISKGSAVSAQNVDALKRALASGRPVGIGVPIFKSAWTGGYSWLRGEVQMPLVTTDADKVERVLDERLGSHAICLVGYRDNDPDQPETSRPGGGFFAFRNSWGTEWGRAPDKPLTSGYGILPYAYVERYGLDAQVIEDLVLDGKQLPWPKWQEASAKPESAEKPSKATRAGKKKSV